MSELKEIGIRWEENGELHFSHVYHKSEVDAAIAELKAKLADKEAENRKLKRALYKACANWACAKVEYERLDSDMFTFGITTEKEVLCESMMKKCLKMITFHGK